MQTQLTETFAKSMLVQIKLSNNTDDSGISRYPAPGTVLKRLDTRQSKIVTNIIVCNDTKPLFRIACGISEQSRNTVVGFG